MLYIPWMVIFSGHNIKKKVSKTSIFELPGVKNCISRLCTNPLGPPPPRPVGPNFSHHKARVQAVGWFPLGTRKQGWTFCCPYPPPPQQK